MHKWNERLKLIITVNPPTLGPLSGSRHCLIHFSDLQQPSNAPSLCGVKGVCEGVYVYVSVSLFG